MRDTWLKWWVVAVALFASWTEPAPAQQDAAAQKTWSDFRKGRPHPIQTLALSREADGSRVLIISEPSPHVTEQQLRAHSPHLAGLSFFKHAIGYRGWVKDAVVRIKTNDAETADLVASLSRLLYHTAYKAHALQLPVAPIKLERGDLDLRISAADLERWLVKNPEQFRPSEVGPSQSLAQIASLRRSVVFIGTKSSLVLWWLPRSVKVADSAVQARQFGIDSDLLLGGFANDKGLLLIGRQRILPVDVLPPMRAETVALLMAVRGEHLAQSFERLSAAAGAWTGKLDWAPIYLSPELVDTEYGMLLIITDMIIKAWTTAGDTGYENFWSERPDSFPFPAPLSKVLNVNGLTYNWNTAGTGYSLSMGDWDVFALNRTGALPASYIPTGAKTDARVEKAEDDAYEYFAQQSDVQLAQVSRYAGLFQISRAFWKTPEPRPNESLWPAQTYARELENLLRAARGADEKTCQKAATRLADDLAQRVPGGDKRLEKPAKTAILQLRDALRDVDDEELNRLSLRLIDGRYAALGDGFPSSRFLTALAALHDLPAKYAQTVEERCVSSIHTPVVVVSWRNGAIPGVQGGHNVDAAIPFFKPSVNVKGGEVRVRRENGKLVVEHNPADSENAARAARLIGRRDHSFVPPAVVEAEAAAILRSPLDAPRDPATALKTPPPPTPPPPLDPPGFAFGDPFPKKPGRGVFSGWQVFDATLPRELQERFRARQNGQEPILFISDGPNSFQVRDLRNSASLRSFTWDGAIDALEASLRSGGNGRFIHLVNLSPAQERGVVTTLRLRAQRNLGRPVDFLVHSGSPTPEELNAAMSRPHAFGQRQTQTFIDGKAMKLETTVPRMTGVGNVKHTTTVFSANPLPSMAQELVSGAHADAMQQTFPANSDLSPQRLLDLHERLSERLRQVSERTGVPVEGLLMEVQFDAFGVTLGRNEKARDSSES